MSELKGKIDFTLFVSVQNANPNGDPLNGNRPRIDMDGYGEISDVCINRKIRNRLQDLGARVFVQSDDRSDDGFRSLKERAESCSDLKEQFKTKKKEDLEDVKVSNVKIRDLNPLVNGERLRLVRTRN